MKRTIRIKSMIFLFVLFVQQAFAQSENLNVTQFTLPNGLTVYLNEDHSTPEVFGAVAVKAGSKYDPKDATGMAHYLEHMCFKGTATMGTTNYEKEKPLLDEITRLYDELGKTTNPDERAEIQKKINEISVQASEYAIPNEMDRLLKSIGSTGVNAFTSFEMVVYHNLFPAHQVEKWLDLYAVRFIDPVFRLFQSELEVVYEEKNVSADNFGTALFETYLENFFKNHPYGQQTTIGETEHLKNPPLSKMQEYYDTYFVANNMALIITGDFETETIIPIIREKFGAWKSGIVPVYPEYNEVPFNGRELLEERLSPVKIGLMGYRTVSAGHRDEEGLEVLNYLLTNSGETGLIDQLRQNNEVQLAASFPLSLEDHGGFGIFFLPKIIGQSLDDAESLILAQIAKLRSGDFDDELLEAARNNLRADFYRNLEDKENRALFMVDVFIHDEEWEDFLAYPDRIVKITREDIIRLANAYFGDNFLVLHSKMGLPAKDKLEKPGFEPVKPKEGVNSSYAEYFTGMESERPKPDFVNFENDLSLISMPNGDKLYVTPNPINDIFTATIEFQVGTVQLTGLDIAADYLNYIGADSLTAMQFKRKMNVLGCSYSVHATEENLVVSVSGLEENAREAIELVRKLIWRPQADEDKLALMVSDIRTNYKLEMADASSAAAVLSSFLIYGQRSDYLHRLSQKEVSSLTPQLLEEIISRAREYPVTIHYVGKKVTDDVNELFTSVAFSEHSALPVQVTTTRRMHYEEPMIYILHRGDARQSHIYFYADGNDAYDIKEMPGLNAFNSYFGEDMSSLVFQEIREIRSLAYTSYMIYRVGERPGVSKF
ncbi:MAG: insulinase family protein, partial [Bacteroidota bacterium]|nr:insulinase family protein [Bacteroidota bacterium]